MLTSALRILSIVILATASASAQTFAGTDLTRADEMLERVYNSIFARAGVFIDIACFIGAMGAIIMISTHIYGRMIRGKSIHLSAVARPIIIMGALILYTPLVEFVNLVLSPTVTATKAMVGEEHAVLENVLQEMENFDEKSGQAAAYGGYFDGGDFQKYIEAYDLEEDTGYFGEARIGQFISWRIESQLYKMRWAARQLLFYALGFLYTAVVFCISAIRTFTLAVLALVGPLALGFSLWEPFSRSFVTWLGRYIGVYLWLPVANIFGFLISTIMSEFSLVHLETAQAGGSNVAFSSLDIMYAIMLVTGIVGYIAVPSITAYIINASGASSLLSGATGAGKAATSAAVAGTSAFAGAVAGDVFGRSPSPSPGPSAGHHDPKPTRFTGKRPDRT